ncbi:hypothetical protein LV779_16725 [Streptomyces thinghirensis]|nr:hypothetical protein [Streptomyces thinghirensis]
MDSRGSGPSGPSRDSPRWAGRSRTGGRRPGAVPSSPSPVRTRWTWRWTGAEGEPGEPQIRLGITGPGEYDPDSGTDPEPVPNNGYSVTIDATAPRGLRRGRPAAVVRRGRTDRRLRHEQPVPRRLLQPELEHPPRPQGHRRGRRLRQDTGDGRRRGPGVQRAHRRRAGRRARAAEEEAPGRTRGLRGRRHLQRPARLPQRRQHGGRRRGPALRRHARPVLPRLRYDNCSYAEENKNDLIRYQKVALCTFEGEFPARHRLRTERAGPGEDRDFALGDIFHYGFDAVGAEEADALRSGADYRQGPADAHPEAGQGRPERRLHEVRRDRPAHAEQLRPRPHRCASTASRARPSRSTSA